MTNRIHTLLMALCWLLPAALLTSCFYDHPTLTDDGELGVDPTGVTLKAQLSLNFPMPALYEGQPTLDRPLAGDEPQYRHRFVAEVYSENRALMARQIVYEDIADGRSSMQLPLTFKLHARRYTVAVWSDYVQTPNAEEGINGTEEYFYNTTDHHLLSVITADSYRGQNEYRDAFCGAAEVDLTAYDEADEEQVSIDLELTRPVGRYQLVANDVAKFLSALDDGKVTGESFTIRVKYNSYLNLGYNVLDACTRHGLLYVQYRNTVRTSALREAADGTYPIAFDYVFANPGDKQTAVPLTVEVVDSQSKVVAATTFQLGVLPGRNTTITHSFLTANPDGGITFDPGYDGDFEVDVPGSIQ